MLALEPQVRLTGKAQTDEILKHEHTKNTLTEGLHPTGCFCSTGPIAMLPSVEWVQVTPLNVSVHMGEAVYLDILRRSRGDFIQSWGKTMKCAVVHLTGCELCLVLLERDGKESARQTKGGASRTWNRADLP